MQMNNLDMQRPVRMVTLCALLAASPSCLLAQALGESEIIWSDSVSFVSNDPEVMEILDDMEDMIIEEQTFIFPTALSDGWHLTAHAGAFQSWGSYTDEAAFLDKTNPAFGVSVGKYLSPVNDVRLQLLWGRHTGVYGRDNLNQWGHHVPNWHFYSVSLAAQYLPNLTNLIWGYDPKRPYALNAMAGISLMRTYGYARHNPETQASLDSMSVWAEAPRAGAPRSLVGLQFGLELEYNVGRDKRLTLEVTNNFVDDIFDGRLSGHVWDGHVNVLLGMTWHLYNQKVKNARIRNRFNEDKYEELEEIIYRNREKVRDLQANPTIEVEERDVHKKLTYTLVAMNEGEVSVSRLQQVNIYTAATLWNTYTARGQKTMIFVTNNSKVDDKLFRDRAWTICNLLANRWQVAHRDIRVVADESMIREMNLVGYEHYVVLVINEPAITK